MKHSKASRNGLKARTRKKPRDLQKALTPAILAEAKEIADQYTLLIQRNSGGSFLGSSVEFPTVFIDARTERECAARTREALMVGVAVMLKAGESPPLPMTDESRDQQVNIRLTAKEKLRIEGAAQRSGFRGVSDFIRTAALEYVRRSA